MTKDFPLLWIALAPLMGAAFNLTIGRHVSRRTVHVVACGSVVAALLVVLTAIFCDVGGLWSMVWAWKSGAPTPALVHNVYQWLNVGPVLVEMAMRCDPLTAVMLVVVTFVGSLIHIYATGYMAHDRDYARFFGYLNLFTGAMLLLVLADNLAVMFIGWEGVGLCSYLLIGFWYDKDGTERLGLANAKAGRKAFLVNRVGDFAFVIGMLVLFSATGTLNFEQLADRIPALLKTQHVLGFGPFPIAAIAALLLFIGATGKSAQIPLFIWLPDAMAGPTPVSALIHAATMVTAGVYMIARLNFLYVVTPTVMAIVALVGAMTALFAATIAFAQNDIKKVLAYSTISQLGYMFIGVGVGAFSAGVFHLFTHAFFKACLFLGAGAVIHAVHGQQDITHMGGLHKKLPVTSWTFLIATLAIAGLPPLSGFFSKDEILWQAIATGNPQFGAAWLPALIYVLGMAGAFCTAFYMVRLYGLTFLGKCRLDEHAQASIHQPSWAMRVPLIVLSGFAAIVGPLALPTLLGKNVNLFARWLAPTVGRGYQTAASLVGIDTVAPNALHHSHALEAMLMLLSIAVAVASSYAAYRFYRSGPSNTIAGFVGTIPRLYRLVLDKYRIDELYAYLVVKPFRWTSRVLFKVADRIFIDTIAVRGAAAVVEICGWMTRRWQNGNLQHYIVTLLIGLALLVYWVSVPPSAFSVTPGETVTVGTPVTFDARPAVASGAQLQYRWDFNSDGKWDLPREEGAWTTDAVVTHTFTEAREYRVILRVHDPRWKTWKQRVRTITVVEPVSSEKATSQRQAKTKRNRSSQQANVSRANTSQVATQGVL